MSIVGPSGSGKSTTLGLLGCLDLPNSGIVRVDGIDVAGLDDARRSALRGDSIGFVFQQFHLIPHLSAAGNVETALLYRNLKASERRRRAETALERVGLVARDALTASRCSQGCWRCSSAGSASASSTRSGQSRTGPW